MKKRKGSLLQRMMAVLLSAVLMTGMVWDAVPMAVFAQESVSGNSAETVEGDVVPEEGTDFENQEDTEEEGTEETVTEDADAGTGQETPEPGTEEETEPGTVSGNDAEAESVAAPQIMMMAAAVQVDNIASGEGWALDADGRLTIESDDGMNDWISNGRSIYKDDVTIVEIQSGVSSIGEFAFHDCSSLESITMSEKVTSIGVYAFYNCSSLTSITIPGSVTSIESNVFNGCSSLTSITIPGSVTRIGSNVFNGCNSLTSITIPDSVTDVGHHVFNGCSSLKSITISSGITGIGGGMFSGCSNLESITIPDSVTIIGFYAFSDCSSLTEITIPNSVTRIDDQAFYNCSKLTKVNMKRDTPPSLSKSEDLFSGCGFVIGNTQGIHVPKDKAQTYKDAWTDWAAYITDGTHTHSWSSDWRTNSTHHWRECTVQGCTVTDNADKDSYGEHIYDNDSDTDCNTCGYKRTVTHTHTLSYTASRTMITQTCSGCSLSATATLSSDKEEYPYTGNAIEPFKVTYSADWVGEKPKDIVYENNTNPGRATAKLTIGGATVVRTFMILSQTVESDTDKAAAAKTVVENALAGITATNATTYEEIVGVINTALSNAGIMGVTVSIDKFIKMEATTSAEGHIEGYVQITCGEAIEGLNMNKLIAKLTEGGDNQGGSGGGNTGGSGNSSGNQGDNGESDDPDGSNSGNNGGAGEASIAPGGSGIEQPRVKQEQEGNIRKEVSVTGESTLYAAVETPLSRLADIVLTETEKQQAADGTDIRIVLDVKDASASVSDADRKIVETALHGSTAKGYTLGQYFDISLYKVIGDSRNIIKETDSRLTVTLSVPDSLKNTDSTRTRIFAVIRVHDGKAEILSDLDSNEDTITIETDRFSTYAVVYQDAAGENGDSVRLSAENGGNQNPVSGKDNEPKTGDAAPTELYATFAMIAGFAYLLLYFTDRSRGMTEETKKELVSRLVRWAKQGGWIRRCLALAAVFVLLVYYHSIGKKTYAEWKEIYGE